VVGVVANLTLWCGLRVLFDELRELRLGPVALDMPVLSCVAPSAVALAILAARCVFRLRWGVMATSGITAGAGLVIRLPFAA